MSKYSPYVRVRVVTQDRNTQETHVQLNDYNTDLLPILDILKEVRNMFKGSNHDITSLTYRTIDADEFRLGCSIWC